MHPVPAFPVDPSPPGALRAQRTSLPLFLLIAALVAGCGEAEPRADETASSSPPAASAPSGGSASSGKRESLACEQAGYPCTWAETDSATRHRTDAVGRLAARLMLHEKAPARVARFLDSVPGVAEVQSGELAVRFRLEGGRAAWIYAPFDPENPRLGGVPPAPRAAVRAMASPPHGADFGLRPPDRQEADRVAGETGGPKRALVVSPYEWQGDKTSYLVDILGEVARDYRRDAGGSVLYRANLSEGVLTLGPGLPPGFVTLQDFMVWKKYDLVYVATHGARVCRGNAPLAAKGTARPKASCHTSLMVGQYLTGTASPILLELAVPGLELVYSLTNLADGLSGADAEACVQQIDGGAKSPTVPGTGDSCLETDRKPYVSLAVTTEFFRWAYPSGLEDAVLFLAACQSLMAGDLVDHFTQNGKNRDIAVFGYDGAVYSDHARNVGREFANLLADPRIDTETIREKLSAITPQFTGTILGPEDAPLGEIAERSSGPTHALDVAEMVDPFTGEELSDGATVVLRGTLGDGTPDTLGVRMRVRGISENLPPAGVALSVSVDDGSYGPPVTPGVEVDEHIWAAEDDDAPLGRDLPEGSETVDLTVRAELTEDGESRWTYRDIRLESCWFRIEYGGARNGVVEGYRIIHNTRNGYPYEGPDAETAGFGFLAPDEEIGLALGFQDPWLPPGSTGTWVRGAGELDYWDMEIRFGRADLFSQRRPPQFGDDRNFRLTLTENDWDDRIIGSFEGTLWRHREGDLQVSGRFVWKRGACSII